jgi:mRNA interferase RelE/StbE
MIVKILPKAKKYLDDLNEPIKSRIKKAIKKLPQGDVKFLNGRDGYRLRVGKYRVLFEFEGEMIDVYEIGLRGQVYKGAKK